MKRLKRIPRAVDADKVNSTPVDESTADAAAIGADEQYFDGDNVVETTYAESTSFQMNDTDAPDDNDTNNATNNNNNDDDNNYDDNNNENADDGGDVAIDDDNGGAGDE